MIEFGVAVATDATYTVCLKLTKLDRLSGTPAS
jgi:hypothetical protein